MRLFITGLFLLTSIFITRLEAETALDRVRKDAGLCVIVRDLPEHVQALRESALRQRLQSLALFKRWQESLEYQQLQTTVALLNGNFGNSVPDALLNLAGDEIVLAVYPRAENKPAGVLISAPRNPQLARKTVEFWNQLETAELTELPQGYWKRTTDKCTLYYLLDNRRFALSDREALIRDLAETPEIPLAESIHEAPGWQRAQSRFDKRSWLRVWFRPEIWSGTVELPDEKPGLEMLLSQLKRAESATLEFDTEDGVHTSFRLLYKPEREPELLMDYRNRYPAAAGILDLPSPDSLLFLSGRGGVRPLARLLASGWPDPQAREPRYFRTVLRGFLQGRDPYEDVLPRIGKAWSIDIRRVEQEAAQPVDILLKISLQNNEEQESQSSLVSALQNLLSTGLRTWRDYEATTQEDLTTIKLDPDTRLTVYQSIHGWEPSFAVTEDQLVISSSLACLRKTIETSKSESQSTESPFNTISNRPLASSQFGLLINLKALRSELETRPKDFLELLRVPQDRRTSFGAALSDSADTLKLFDAGYFLWNCGTAEWSAHWGAVVQPE